MQTFETTSPVDVTVDLEISGDVVVTATDRDEVTADIRPRNPQRALDVKMAESAEVDFADGRLLVRVANWRRFISFSDGGVVDIAITAPIGSSLDVKSGMGSLVAEGEFAAAELRSGMGEVRIGHCSSLTAKTGFGDVVAQHVTGRADVHTGSGRIRIAEIDGPATVKNSNGDTLLGSVGGELRARSSNGAIVVDRAGGDVSVKSSSGPLTIGEVGRGTVVADTGAGAIEIGVRDGTAAWLELTAKFGRVYSALTASDGPAGSEESVQIRARSAYGDITIHRAQESA